MKKKKRTSLNIASRCQDMTSVDFTPSGLGCYASNPDDRPVNLRKPRRGVAKVVRRNKLLTPVEEADQVWETSDDADGDYVTTVFPLEIEAGSIESWGFLDCDDERLADGQIQLGVTREGRLVIKEVYQGPMPIPDKVKNDLNFQKWIEVKPKNTEIDKDLPIKYFSPW